MSNNNINLEQQFFDHTNHQEIHFMSIPQEDNPMENKHYEANGVNGGDALNGQNGLPEGVNLDKYYQEFRRIYLVSHHLESEKQRLEGVVRELQARVRAVDAKFSCGEVKGVEVRSEEVKSENHSDENRSKRPRRTAEEIQKKFKCEATYCQRFYGSQGSLQQHIKLKHPKEPQESSDEYRPTNKDKLDGTSD